MNACETRIQSVTTYDSRRSLLPIPSRTEETRLVPATTRVRIAPRDFSARATEERRSGGGGYAGNRRRKPLVNVVDLAGTINGSRRIAPAVPGGNKSSFRGHPLAREDSHSRISWRISPAGSEPSFNFFLSTAGTQRTERNGRKTRSGMKDRRYVRSFTFVHSHTHTRGDPRFAPRFVRYSACIAGEP